MTTRIAHDVKQHAASLHVRSHALSTFAAIAALFVTSAAMAAVSNLESYHFRFDFSKGNNSFIRSAYIASNNIVADFVGNQVTPVEGPNGAGSAVHITAEAWQAFGNQSILNADWTLAMCFRPGTQEGGTIVSLGRLPNTGSSAVAICSSSDTSKLYITVVTRNSKGTYALEKKNELTGLGDVTQGYHTLVVAHKYSSTDKKGTLYFYWDGVSKGSYTLTSGYPFGADSSISGMQFHKLVTRGATAVDGFTHKGVSNDSKYSFYDVRLYPGQFNDSDARAYAAFYPADRMGSPFRPSAYVESGATNAVANAIDVMTPVNYIDTGYAAKKGTEFVLDFQYLDWSTTQQYIFGVWNGNANSTPTVDGTTHCFYINGNKGFSFTRFSGTSADWHAITAANKADRIRRIVTVDNADDASDTGSTATILTWADRSTMATASVTKDHALDAKRNTYLFAINANDEAKRFARARIYSFEADEDGAPALFLAPDMENGEAGFRNIIDGTFHGDGNKSNNPERTLRFYNGVGCASDYKYENDTLYAKLYATSDEGGTVSVAGGSSAASAEGWIPRGGTLALSATPPENMLFNAWIGDTWAIADGSSATDASIEVATPYATQLRATFKPAVPALLTIAANGADAVNWSVADWRNINNPEETITAPVDKDVTIVAHKSFTLTLDMDVALSNLTVQADANCVVTLVKGDGSLVTVETIVESGVLKLGSDNVLGKTPKVTVQDGGTFDMNGKVVGDGEAITGNVVTEFHIAGAGAGNYPWALTSSADMANSKNVGKLYLDADATIGGANALWIGVRDGAGWDKDNKNVNLDGHTLTKTGSGNLNIRRPYSGTGGGTIDIQTGTLRITDWSNADVAYGESCVSNIALVVREGTTVENGMQYGKSRYTLYFKSLDVRGVTMTSSYGAFGAWETLSGHGSIEKLAMADGAPAALDGNLTVSGELIAVGALALTRKAGVETNVTVAVTGTLTASGAITVGAGVIFDIGVNRPTGSLTVDDDATLVLRQASIDDEEIVVNVSAQPQNIVLYDINGVEIQSPDVNYDGDAGTVTVRAPTPVWSNTDGTGSFSATENWSSGAVPGEGRSFKMSLDGDTTVMLNSEYVFGSVLMVGSGSVGFGGEGSLALGKVSLTNNVSLATCGRVTVAGLDLPTESAATLTTLDGIAAGGVTGVGTLALTPGAVESVTLCGLSSFAGDFSVTADHSTTGTLTCAATKLKKFTLNGTTNVVFTLVKGSGGSFKASSEVVVAGGVLQQGSDNVLGTTPKITVLDGGTFDINAKTIRQETPIYIAGAGAGNWPWALASSSGAMAEGNYLYDLHLTADATTGAGQLKIGRSSAASFIYLNGHTLTAKSWLTLRNVNTETGTIDLQNSATLYTWNNLNSDNKNHTGTTLIIYEGHYVQNKTDRKIKVSNLIMHGGSITDNNDAKQTFGIIDELHGHGTITKLEMETDAKFYPDGEDFLNVTKTLSGTLKVDISEPAVSGKVKIPLLKVPTALKDTADAAFDLTALPPGWKLESKEYEGNVEYWLKNSGFSIFIR